MIQDIFLLYAIAFAFVALWSLVKTKSKTLQIGLLFSSLIILFLIGFTLQKTSNYTEISRVGNGLIFLSPIIILGPVLSFAKLENRSKLLKPVLYVILPILGTLGIFAVLIFTEQVWGF